ncbi:hypothetical protein RJ639_006384 [Escallonia herrerae]|uniref:Retrotransposon Copia-like N-terminal domain-containing protein n=1 Tax=Escallonia herrerae TaxID=1293975 RepID=A0AA89AVJ1_9ASTE|nr:hypothetical protein RJ639_006384 [Escallonia herrerae]
MEDESASYTHEGLAPVANVQNIAIDTKSSFYLHPSDHPGLVIITQPLSENGENYFTWRRNMLTALQSKNKARFVDQSITKPDVHSGDFQSWIQCNAMVKSWIVNSLSRELQTGAAHADTASEIWCDFDERITQGIALRVYDLKRSIALLQQEKSAISTYYGDQKPDQRGENSGQRRHGGLLCTQCNRSNHSRENCHKIIGYPPGWRRPKPRGRNQPWLCVAKGTAPSVAIAQSFAATANASATFPNDSPAYQPWPRTAGDTAPTATVAQQFAATSDTSVSFLSFTPNEMQRLADLLGRQSGPTNEPSANMTSQNISGKPDSWIINTEATDHISCKIDTMSDAYTNPDIPPVQIPNGDTVPVHALGRVNLGHNLHLEQKGYRIYDLDSKVIYSSRDVQFFEKIFPFASTKDNIVDLQAYHSPFGLTDHLPVDWECQAASHAPATQFTPVPSESTQTSDVPTRSISPHNVDLEPLSLGSSSSQDEMPLDQAPGSTELSPSTMQSPISTEQSTVPVNEHPVVPSKHTRQVSKNLSGYNYTLPPSLAPPSSTSHSSSPSANSTVYPLPHNISYSKFSRTHTAFLAAISSVNEPKYFSQAMKHAHWRDAMAKEISALEANNTWTLVPLPSGKLVFDSSISLIYVDNVIVTGTDSAKISWLKHYLDTKSHIKDLGKLKYFLGIEMACSSDGIALSQRKYVLDILTECGLTGCKPSSSPMAEQHQLNLNSRELCDDPRQYRRLISHDHSSRHKVCSAHPESVHAQAKMPTL